MKVFASKSSKPILNKLCFAVGGGEIIDTAKRYASKHQKVCMVMPTTGSGASQTSHAVRWTKTKKLNIPTNIPITVACPFPITLSKEARQNTDMDIICHLIDVLQKCNDNDRVLIGNDIGKWLEKYGSGLTHKRSYALTLKYGMAHGKALRHVIIPCIEEAYPLEREMIV